MTDTQHMETALALKSLNALAPTSVGGTLISAILAMVEQYGPAIAAEVIPLLLNILFTKIPGTASFVAALQALLASIKIPVTPPAPITP